MFSQQSLIETPTRPIEMLRGKMAQVDLRSGIEELAKMALGQDVGGALTASADVGLIMLRQAATMFLSRRAQAIH